MIGRALDRIGMGLFAIGCVALAAIVGAFVWEVVARSAFNAPTRWTGEAVQYALPLVIFLALPEATRRGAHFAVEVLPERLSEAAARGLGRINALIAATACAAAATLCGQQAHIQFLRGTMTNAIHPIPRWWLTSVLALGLGFAAIELLRKGLERRP